MSSKRFMSDCVTILSENLEKLLRIMKYIETIYLLIVQSHLQKFIKKQ